ncbi:MAG: InlB B-repeat-containing protein, partial [Fibromonadaceae bacterium]|nr:InlB B-repeat-containing protein [Fibromonadaceae bacterium]
MNKFNMRAMATVVMAVLMLATALSAAVFTITLNQNYAGAPGNMVVQTDNYGCLIGAMNAPLVLPSPTRNGYDFRGWFTSSAETGGTRVLSGATGTNFTANTTIYARWTTKTTRTISNIPAMEKEHFNWVKSVRNVCESVMKNSGVSAGNFTFHEIFAGNGSLTWAVRWESDDTVSVQERRRIAAMLYEGTNEWLRPLMGYEDWPFGEIPVTVVGWAVKDASLIRDKQPNETIWVNSTHDGPNSGYTTGDIASASKARSRFLNYTAINNTAGGAHLYKWPDSIGGLNGRFDKYLWLTKKKNEGQVGACGSAEGGDWGFRWGQCAAGSGGSGTNAANVQANNGTINGVMLHEIGH